MHEIVLAPGSPAPFSPPTIESALALIESHARSSGMTPAELVDVFNMGILVRSITLGQRVDDVKPAVLVELSPAAVKRQEEVLNRAVERMVQQFAAHFPSNGPGFAEVTG